MPENTVSCGCCGESQASQKLGKQLTLALVGGTLVLNSYILATIFGESVDKHVADFSAIIGTLILGFPIFSSAVKDLLKGRVYMNELVTLAIIAAFANQEYRTAGAVGFFMLVTIMIEKRTAIGAEASIESLIRLTPTRARRLTAAGQEEDIDVSDLRVGDIFRVRPGENFPADARVVTGTSTVNQATITGESLPVDKAKDDEVYAGTQNLTGAMDAKVLRVGEDTTLGKVKDLIVSAEKTRLPFMRMIDQYAGYYTPTVLMLAALVWISTTDLDRVIAVLVVSCPCALIVATPSAVVAALAAAARLGMLIKDVTHIELAARVKAVVFDKTGTLTEGILEVARLQPVDGVELADLLKVATSTECHSNHPTATAMRKLAREADVTWEDPESYEEVPGKGVQASFDGAVCRVGRKTWLAECGLDVAAFDHVEDDESVQAMSLVYVAKGDLILGWIGLRDAVRPGAAEAIRELGDLGIEKTYMVTGDNESVAKDVCDKVGVSSYRAGCLPHEKVAFVENLRARGELVAFIGDGVNDAPGLAASDIGVAMGAIGSDVAVHSASVALMNNDLRRIPFLIWLSRKARSVMKQNLTIGLAFIIIGLYLAMVGVVTPVLAAVLHAAGTIITLFNSARLVRAGEDMI
ncbi:MAG: cation-translocating P-type ATPase [Lentisphaeria bacterium]|nr:cation-translocating P-type ATPase [Lentisphaeria bacterium]